MNEVVDHKPLLTHEVGSLDKPGWRVKAYAGNERGRFNAASVAIFMEEK